MDQTFRGFDSGRGKAFYESRHGKDWSCETCHTDDPRNPGKHAVTQKILQPMAPVANADRFSDPAKVEKWFKRSCKDVMDRECTPQEKGDFITYLMSVK